MWWMARQQAATLLGGMFFGIVWMSAQAVTPAVLGRAIDRGVAAKDTRQLLLWAGVLLGVGLIQAVSGIMRHRFAVTNWLTAAYRVVQLIGRQAVRLGATLPRKVSTGEVVAIGISDMSNLGQVMDVTARFSGAVVSFLLVSVILLKTSTALGLVVLIGVPLLMLAIGPLLSPLQRRSAHQRELTGHLANTATDIVGGLRVLRGIGGEQVFADKYRGESQQVRAAGIRVARLQSMLDALQVLLPGIFVVLVVWLGARYAVRGEITVGELVAFYGYSAFLMIPLRTATEYANKVIRGRVSAARICRVLAVQPERGDDAAELADRLGLIAPPAAGDGDAAVTLGGVPLTSLSLAEVRHRILVSDTASALFSGQLGLGLDPHRRGRLNHALETASAGDILEALPEGLDTIVTERGRTFSGGQRQRLILARALAVDPEILILVEPTSAVDAHTEARIAARLRDYRRGRTTLVTTSSPLMLDAVDEVVFLVDGKVVARGTHGELLETHPGYRTTVTRESDAEEVVS
jgi:ABC-type multidrug transport system fused ATPase/permease subunit